MILAVNIGNTNIRAAIGRHGKIESQAVVYAEEGLQQIETELALNWNKVEDSIIASVVPSKTEDIIKILENKIQKPVRRINIRSCGSLITNAYAKPLGEDRVVCCARALQKFSPPFAVIDYGTATTINIVNAHGEFIGGSILVGLQTALDALAKNTNQLPQIHTANVSAISIIGKNTVENLQSGAVFGLACATEGMINKMQKELGCKLKIVVTGGHAPYILPYCDFDYLHEPSLLLEGLLSI